MASEIKLEQLKEGVDSVEVNAVKVVVGDVVTKDQPLLEVQADKAALEVPAPVAGRVTKISVKVGDQVKVGQVYCTIDAAGGNGAVKTACARRKNGSRKDSAGEGAGITAARNRTEIGPGTCSSRCDGSRRHRQGCSCGTGHAPPGARAGR